MSNIHNCCWVVIDIEVNGINAPITVIELAAQRMRGWEPTGAPFRRLLNQNADIAPEASRVNGYTREILERDGEPALDVYRDFATYADKLPIVSYNLKYDLDEVLRPEWHRLGVEEIGAKGFCALRLAQRLLDPVAAGNCKLQTLCQFYRLPERGAHTALGDVKTVIDLMKGVIQPLARERGLTTWNDICAFAEEEWFPSRIAFGRFRDRDFRDATKDAELKKWLVWLSREPTGYGSAMAKWHLARLEAAHESSPRGFGKTFNVPTRETPTVGTPSAEKIAIAVEKPAKPATRPAWQLATAACVALFATVVLGYSILLNGARQDSAVREAHAASASIGMTRAPQISVAVPDVAVQEARAIAAPIGVKETPQTSVAVSAADSLSGNFIPASQAQAYIGQRKLVCGNIARLRETSAGLFINLDKPYPNDVMSAIIWRRQLAKIGALGLTENQRVCVLGLIQAYKGKPQIEIDNREQIVP